MTGKPMAPEAVGIEMSPRAQHDSLTNLPTRTLLQDRIQQAIALARVNGTPIAFCFLDLDTCKLINDSLGHPIGDKLLQAVVERLLVSVRASDTVSPVGWR